MIISKGIEKEFDKYTKLFDLKKIPTKLGIERNFLNIKTTSMIKHYIHYTNIYYIYYIYCYSIIYVCII